ncbi:hypothetical protein EDM52_14410 [Brevibacillus invocatus]|uniref:Uncharacterized protein n=1 Tax=Brevibacillus invocatus TaxID=173959 RepID=A0A3M8C8B4_9BACL|nr:hypothetical protein EDM52_14410 [Brevibacillus invocatus]
MIMKKMAIKQSCPQETGENREDLWATYRDGVKKTKHAFKRPPLRDSLEAAALDAVSFFSRSRAVHLLCR